MLTILAYGMIIAFLYLLTKKKLTVYTALILVPIVFGLAVFVRHRLRPQRDTR